MNPLLSQIKPALYQAGQSIMKVYGGHIQVHHKQDNSPVTQADLNSHDILVNHIAALTPNIPIVSEEAACLDDQITASQLANKFWLIDPLDGTKEFIKKNDQFCINVALISNHQPILGLIFIPSHEKLYMADEHGTWVEQHGRIKQLKPFAPVAEKTHLYIISSRSHEKKSHEKKEQFKKFKDIFPQITSIYIGSALKFCDLAQGYSHIYPRFAPTMEWDTAAGHALLKPLGADVFQAPNTPLTYGHPNFKNPNFIACSLDLMAKIPW